jgi:hypothetical protein
LTLFVVLTDVDKSWARQLATAVYDSATNKNLVDEAVNTDADPQDLDLLGYSGELAFAKVANHFPITDVDGPTPVDCVVNGITVDVKTTEYITGHLVVRPKHKGKSAQSFVLMTGTMENGFHYRGWMWAEDVFQDKYLGTLGRGPTYKVPQSDLNQGLPA